jgi:hypothetical protein
MWNRNKRAIIPGSQSLLPNTQNYALYWLATQAVPGPSVGRRRLIEGEEEQSKWIGAAAAAAAKTQKG